jgi:hypothetical protein
MPGLLFLVGGFFSADGGGRDRQDTHFQQASFFHFLNNQLCIQSHKNLEQ